MIAPDRRILPAAQSILVDQAGRATPPFYDFMRRVVGATSITPDLLSKLERLLKELTALEAELKKFDPSQYTRRNSNERIGGKWSFVQSILGADGTAEFPEYTFVDDQGTGLFRVGDGNLGISTAEVMRWDIDTERVNQTVDLAIAGDDLELQIGEEADLRLYHDGTDSFIVNDAGDLNISSAGEIYSAEGGTPSLRHSLANPTAKVGLTAVNGTSLQPMRSDASPALDQGIDPTWTGEHIFTLPTTFTDDVLISGDDLELQIGEDADLRLFHDGTDSIIRNDTGSLLLLDGATQVAQVDNSRMSVGISEATIASIDGLDTAAWSLAARSRFEVIAAGEEPRIEMSRVNGTFGSPTALSSNVTIFSLFGRAYYTTGGPGFHANAAMYARTLEVPTSTAAGSRWLFRATPIGSVTPTDSFEIRSDSILCRDGEVSAPAISFISDVDSGLYRSAANSLRGAAGGVDSYAWDNDNTAGNTRFLIYDVDNGTLERVSVGAADSGGVGFKVLRIPN